MSMLTMQLLAVALSGSTLQAGVQYTVIDLGTLCSCTIERRGAPRCVRRHSPEG